MPIQHITQMDQSRHHNDLQQCIVRNTILCPFYYQGLVKLKEAHKEWDMLFKQPISNAIYQQKGHNYPWTFLSARLLCECQLRTNIYDLKYLAVKITDFCLPSRKLIKCLSSTAHRDFPNRLLQLLVKALLGQIMKLFFFLF